MRKKFFGAGWIGLAALVLAGCSTIDSRIKDKQEAFDAYPAEVQAAVREGKVKVGFTPEQVEIALGKPDRIYSRTKTGVESEVWAYTDNSPSFGVGLGVGVGGPVGLGAGVNSRDYYYRDRMRVVFENGAVSELEEIKK